MKKLFCASFFMMISCLCFWQDFCFLDTLKSLDLAGYSIFCDDNIMLNNFDDCLTSGNIKIYSFDKENISNNFSKKDVLCEQVFLSKNDSTKYIKNNDLLHIKSEVFDGLKITYFLCKKLPKTTNVFGQVFNIVIAEKNDGVIIGYPAIMGSL